MAVDRVHPEWPRWQFRYNGLRAELNQAQEENERLKAGLVEQTQSDLRQSLIALESRVDQLFNQQAQYFLDATHALGKHISQRFLDQRRNLESAWALQSYLLDGPAPLPYGGWAVGADLAAELVRTVEKDQFDCIIEFGSGTSTVVLAKAVAKQQQTPLRHIISFEQNPSWQAETAARLAQYRLDGVVHLVPAPLIPTQHGAGLAGTEESLFYDCDSKLADLAATLQSGRASIFILVDGPQSPQGDPLARAPALGALLRHLSAHQLHVVLDDTHREGEQRVAEFWASVCHKRGLSFQQGAWSTEKGATHFIINPD